MQRGGVDIIELGVPFSDPIADGPAIQETNTVCPIPSSLSAFCIQVCQIAVHNAIDYATVLGQVREARQQGLTIPVLLMG